MNVWERGSARSLTTKSRESWAAYQANLKIAEDQGVIGALDRYHLDALVMPTFTSFYLPAIAGLPIVTVPLGFFPPGTPLGRNAKGTLYNVAPGIPFGLAFIGRKWSEETLISFAYAFEQRTMIRGRRRPNIQPATQLGRQAKIRRSSAVRSAKGKSLYSISPRMQNPRVLESWSLAT